MNGFDGLTSLASRVHRYFGAFVVAWTLIVSAILLQDIHEIHLRNQEMVKREALVYFNKDMAARLWASSHGGVYVAATEETPPNPFLSHVPDRDLLTPGGKALTLMNPAYMIRQMMEHYADLYGVRGHITSLKHFREETAPDDWERTALASFESGAREVCEFAALGGRPHFRLMRPLIAEAQCLGCHGAQGYKVGDIRGGVSVSVPLSSYLTAQREEIINHIISFSILWLLGLGGIGLAVRGLKIHLHEREKAEDLLERSQKNYSTLVENSLTGIYTIQDGVIKFANNRAAEIFGYAKDELIGMSSLALVHPEDRGFVEEVREMRLKGEAVPSEYDARGIRKDGSTIWIQRRNSLCEYDGRPAVLGKRHGRDRAQKDARRIGGSLQRACPEQSRPGPVRGHCLPRSVGTLEKNQRIRGDHEGKIRSRAR